MASALTVDVTQVVAFAHKLDGAPAVVAKATTDYLNRITIAGTNFAKEATPVDTGRLRGAWTQRVSGDTGVIENATDYARPVNDGRRAGAAAPPPGALAGWLSRHGIDPSAEYVVGRAIAAHGIPAKNMVEKTMAQLPAVAESAQAQLAADIKAGLGL